MSYKANLVNKPGVDASYVPQAQQGIALITVLMILILILIVGTIAVRQSNQDLKVATAAQINTLLLQGADSANVKIEDMINGSSRSQTYLDATADNGVFGYFFKPANKSHEVIYCYNPRQLQTMITGAKIFVGTNVLTSNSTGNCDPSASSSYISGRNAVMTQVSVKLSDAVAASEGYQTIPIGRDINVSTSAASYLQNNYDFDIRATSALPAYNDPEDCFTKSSVAGTPTLRNCLVSKQVPSKQIYTQATMSYTAGKINCTPYGVGTGDYASTKCTLNSMTSTPATGAAPSTGTAATP